MTREDKQKEKVYVILRNSYELDDISYGELTPSFMSLNKGTVIKEFNKIKEREISWFNELVEKKEEWLNEHPEFKEDYQIPINTDNELEIYVGNWCYHWMMTEYELK